MGPAAAETPSLGDLALRVRGVSKRFPGVQALDGVDFALAVGEVHALVGENGAGKSTLVKVLTGAIRRDAGTVEVFGHPMELRSPAEALRAGIAAIYQEFNLVPHLTVAENIFLGREPRRRAGFLHWRELETRARQVLSRMQISLDPAAVVAHLSVAGQQMVEIAKALSVGARILVMDEPSAALTEHDLKALFEQVKRLQGQGVSVIYISHRLAEIFDVADRATVLRDGRVVGTRRVQDLDEVRLVRMMVGRDLEAPLRGEGATAGEVGLRAVNLRAPGVEGCSLQVRRGEVVGVAGLVGSGRSELARAIFGASPRDGQVYVDGRLLRPGSPRAAFRAGLGLLAEDRKLQALLMEMTVRENVTLSNLAPLTVGGLVRRSREEAAAQGMVERLDIRPRATARPVSQLSGGNQQKVVLARLLFTQCRVLILDEPTRGVDVGAKAEIHRLIRRLADDGAAVLMISSELPELLKVADRILVMRRGRLVGELAAAQATEERIMVLATGAQGVGQDEVTGLG